MKTLGVFILLLVLCFFGISIGGLLWQSGLIPAWLLSLFLLPSALILDYWAKGEKYPTRIRKYSTTLGVLCMTFAGYLSLEYLGLPIEMVIAVIILTFVLIYAPTIAFLPFFFNS